MFPGVSKAEMDNLLLCFSSSMMGPGEPPLSHLPLCFLSSSALCLIAASRVNGSRRQLGLSDLVMQFLAPTIGQTSENQGFPQPLLALHGTIPVPGEDLVVHHDSLQVLGPASADQVILGLILGLGKAMLSWYLASGSLGAGQGADQGESESRSLQMQLLQGNGAGSLS